jgi:hypothetical protein
MPKVRPIEASFVDIQKHLSVGRSRLSKVPNSPGNIKQHNNIISKIDECMRLTQEILKEIITLEENNNLSQSIPNRTISNELNLIEKEQKKDTPPIDYRAAVRAMCGSNSIKEAKTTGLEFGIASHEVDQVINKAPISTNLGKAVAKYKLALQQQKLKSTPVIPAVKAPIIMEDEEPEVTNDSDDGSMPDDLRQLLASGD